MYILYILLQLGGLSRVIQGIVTDEPYHALSSHYLYLQDIVVFLLSFSLQGQSAFQIIANYFLTSLVSFLTEMDILTWFNLLS